MHIGNKSKKKKKEIHQKHQKLSQGLFIYKFGNKIMSHKLVVFEIFELIIIDPIMKLV